MKPTLIGAGRHVDPKDPMATYDFWGLWRELGIESLRRFPS
jgi:hypothetical protein